MDGHMDRWGNISSELEPIKRIKEEFYKQKIKYVTWKIHWIHKIECKRSVPGLEDC